MLEYFFIGVVGGVAVASWQSYKDPPWEGFYFAKFIRSPIVGGVIAVILYFLSNAGFLKVDNLGVLALAVITIERAFGELFKGFIEYKAHPEYIKDFQKWKLPYHNYAVKLAIGILAFAGVFLLLSLFTKVPYFIGSFIKSKTLIGALSGIIGGLTAGVGGAIKDIPKEGFKYKKVLRSPIAGLIGGLFIIGFTSSYDLLILSTIGFERLVVEFYKTFYLHTKRGIFEGQRPSHREWFKTRWIFIVTYSIAVFIIMRALIFY